jgi:type IV pilus assembly protein PilW
VVSRVGSTATGFRQDAFAVQCDALVRYNAFTTPALPACTRSPLSFGAGVDAIATDVVVLQAQDGGSASPASDIVTQWVEPGGATWGGTPAAADIARIKALRVVMVARSQEPDGAAVSAPCTNAAGVANTGPCSFEDAAAPVIDLSTVPLPAGRSWQNYRYRVHTAILPLRSVLWSD